MISKKKNSHRRYARETKNELFSINNLFLENIRNSDKCNIGRKDLNKETATF